MGIPNRILNPNGHFSAESTTNVELGRRVHVAGVCGADKFQVYVDGKLVATSGNARNRDFKPGTAPHRIGAMFKGVIDEVRISKTPRYDKDFTPAPRLLTDQNTLALYLFDEGSGDLVKDSSGNNHHGKIVGAKWVKASSSPGDASTSEQTSSWELSGRVFLPQLKLDFTKPLTIEAFATPSEASRHHHLFSSGPPEFSLRFVRGGEWEFLGQSTMKLKSQPQLFPRRMHVAAVLDNRQARLYVDGRKVQDATCDASKLAGLNQLHPQLGQDYVGTFDEVRISQISRYDQDFIPQIRFTPDANTVALYHCDEGSGKTLKDSSGNNHHGQIAVAQWVKISGSAAQSPSVETAANQTLASDEWIDVIPLIDPAQDKVDLHNLTGKNDWRLDNGELKFVGDGKPGKLLFPIKYRQANLDWEIEFTRTSGNASFNSDVPATGGAVPIMVDERGAGAVLLGVKSMRLPGAAKIETGKRSRVLFRITHQNNQDALQVVFNNQPAGEWTGDRQTLVKPTNEGYNTAERNGIWIHGGSDYTFHRIRIRAPVGSVSPIRPQNSGLVDLLKTINTGRDADPGTKSNWKLEKGTLVGSGGRMFLPVESIPDEYDLKLRVERKSAGNALVLGLVSGGRRVGLILDGFQSRGGLSGFENIDGKGPVDNGTGVKDKPFSVNQPCNLVVQVRKTGIRVERDGQTFLDWKGNPSQLSLGSTWTDNGPPRLFLGAQAQFEIQRLEFEAR